MQALLPYHLHPIVAMQEELVPNLQICGFYRQQLTVFLT
jgi:hypothetical protein